MKKILIAFMVVGTIAKPMSTTSDNWILYGTNLANDKMYVNTATMGHSGALAWGNTTKIRSTDNVQENAIMYEVNCSTNMISSEPYYNNWTVISHGTVGALLRNILCYNWDQSN